MRLLLIVKGLGLLLVFAGALAAQPWWSTEYADCGPAGVKCAAFAVPGPESPAAALEALLADPPARYLTEADLGVPSWFVSDGCTRPGRNRDWTFVGCRLHDWLYADGWWIGEPEEAEQRRRLADHAMRIVNRHNAGWRPDGGRVTGWSRVKRRLEVWLQFFGVREAARAVHSFRLRREGPLHRLPPAQAFAILRAEGKVAH